MLAKCAERTTNDAGAEVWRVRDSFGELLAERPVQGDPGDAAWLADQGAIGGDLSECQGGCGTLCQTGLCGPCYERYQDASA